MLLKNVDIDIDFFILINVLDNISVLYLSYVEID